MDKQVLVTGGTGFIGRQVVRLLLGQGYQVRVLTRRPQEGLRILGDRVELVAGNLDNAAQTLAAVQGMDAIIHVGGLYLFGPAHRKALWQTNVIGTAHLLESAAQARIKKVIHVGSAGILAAPHLPLREDDFPPPPPRSHHYKNSKWHAEQLVQEWVKKGLDISIASPTCPIGPEDELPTPTGGILREFLAGHFPFVTRTGLNFIDVRDVAAGIVRMMDAGQPGHRYILGHKNLSLPDFLQLLADHAHRPAPRLVAPGHLILMAGIGAELLGYFLPSVAERLCLETACQCQRQQTFDNSRTRSELNWQPQIPFSQTLEDAVAWFQTHTPPP